MKKGLLFLLAAILVASSANAAALLNKGTSELAIAGMLDFKSADGTATELEVRYGYFFWDRISVAGVFSIADSRHADTYLVGGIAEYNFTLPEGWRPMVGTDLVPYVGGGILYGYSDIYDFSGDAMILRADAGIKFFLTDSASLTLALVGCWSTEDIYEDDDHPEDWDISMQLGMRLYF